jgi:hypothetical protein
MGVDNEQGGGFEHISVSADGYHSMLCDYWVLFVQPLLLSLKKPKLA